MLVFLLRIPLFILHYRYIPPFFQAVNLTKYSIILQILLRSCIVLHIFHPKNAQDFPYFYTGYFIAFPSFSLDSGDTFRYNVARQTNRPYQERWRDRPDEARQPAQARCQIRR